MIKRNIFPNENRTVFAKLNRLNGKYGLWHENLIRTGPEEDLVGEIDEWPHSLSRKNYYDIDMA